MNVLWVTSFAHDMWEASGRDMLQSFLSTNTLGSVFVGAENVDFRAFPAVTNNPKVLIHAIDKDPLLVKTLVDNKDVIPLHLGGRHSRPECRCKGGPFPPHYKHHKMPCVGHWFNKNFFRWFRKLVTLDAAFKQHPTTDVVIWVDSDCRFIRSVTEAAVFGWFNGAGCFYFKNKRPVMEAGIVGYNKHAGGRTLFDVFLARYTSKKFRNDQRWDDSYQLQLAIAEVSALVNSVDLAMSVGAHAAVVDDSVVGSYIVHSKGRHGRKMKIMT